MHMLPFKEEKIYTIYPKVSPMCDKCKYSNANHLCCFAPCPQMVWCDASGLVFLIQCPHAMISPEPLLIIRGVSESFKNLNKAQPYFISHGNNMAKKHHHQSCGSRNQRVHFIWRGSDRARIYIHFLYISANVCVCVCVEK